MWAEPVVCQQECGYTANYQAGYSADSLVRCDLPDCDGCKNTDNSPPRTASVTRLAPELYERDIFDGCRNKQSCFRGVALVDDPAIGQDEPSLRSRIDVLHKGLVIGHVQQSSRFSMLRCALRNRRSEVSTG